MYIEIDGGRGSGLRENNYRGLSMAGRLAAAVTHLSVIRLTSLPLT